VAAGGDGSGLKSALSGGKLSLTRGPNLENVCLTNCGVKWVGIAAYGREK